MIRIRQNVINGFGQKVTRINQVTGELSTGTVDKHGREIFENDKVRVVSGRDEFIVKVTFTDGTFLLDDAPLFIHDSDSLEVVGYAGDDHEGV